MIHLCTIRTLAWSSRCQIRYALLQCIGTSLSSFPLRSPATSPPGYISTSTLLPLRKLILKTLTLCFWVLWFAVMELRLLPVEPVKLEGGWTNTYGIQHKRLAWEPLRWNLKRTSKQIETKRKRFHQGVKKGKLNNSLNQKHCALLLWC